MTAGPPGLDAGTADDLIPSVVVGIRKHIEEIQLQCRGKGDGLEGRSRFKAHPDRQIAVDDIRIILRITVWIKVGFGDHGQDLSGIRIHGDRQRLFGFIAFHQIAHLPLHDVLYV